MRLLQHAGREIEEGLGRRKLGGFFSDVAAQLGLHLARDLAHYLLQGGWQGVHVRRKDWVGQVHAREELLPVGHLGQVAVGGQHDAAQCGGGALFGAVLLQQDLWAVGAM